VSEAPLSVLQVLRAPVGGLFRHVADVTRGLVARGHRVGLVMEDADVGPHWEKTIAELSAVAPMGVTRIPMPRGIGPGDMGAVRHVRARLKAECFDVVHGHGAKGGAYARVAASLMPAARRPVRVYTPHGGSLHFDPTSLEGRVYHGLEKALARASEAIVFESAFARARFHEVLGLANPAWPVIHNGLAPPEFDVVEPRPDAVDVVFVGEMRALKGVDVLLDALARLPGATALFVGGGPDLDAYKARAAEPDLAGRVAFAAPMPARAAFARGRVVAVPSRAESLPYLVLEAAAAGVPLVATRVGGIPEIFGGQADRLIAPGEADALADRLSTLLAAPETARAEAESLRAFVRGRFAIDVMVDALVTLYRANLNRNGTKGA
jgi:glycosyltransferase involved in cell wall biosynthesis